jgi:hypothetical protein
VSEERQQRPRRHTVIVDGRIIYDGPDWDTAVRLWREEGQRRDVRWVEHKIDGKQAAFMGWL